MMLFFIYGLVYVLGNRGSSDCEILSEFALLTWAWPGKECRVGSDPRQNGKAFPTPLLMVNLREMVRSSSWV